MCKILLLAAFLLLSCQLLVATNVTQKHDCEKLLHELANNQMLFIYCTTVHSVPVKLCTECQDHYGELTEAYNLLAKNKTCSETYIDKDRLNIVPHTQAILTGLWTKAFCDDCCNNSNSDEFFKNSSDLDLCFSQHKNKECVACLSQYQALNDFYISMDQHNNGKVCYDMQDKMNRTRLQWSKDFNCCHREFNRTFFLFASGLVGILPILFYGSMYALTKRRERNHGLLDAEPELDEPIPTTSAVVTEQQNHSEPEPAPLPAKQAKPKMFATGSDDDSVSDEAENAWAKHKQL